MTTDQLTFAEPDAPWPVPYHRSWNRIDSTKIMCHLQCPRKFFFEYVLGWRPDTPSNHLIFGDAIHIALEYMLNTSYEHHNVMAAYELFLKRYREVFPPDTDSLFWPKTPDNALFVLVDYAQHYARDLDDFEVVKTEIAATVPIGRYQVCLRADTILYHHRDGKYSSMDHKTGSSTWGWEAQFPLSVQSGTYNHFLRCMYEPELVRGVSFNGLFFLKSRRAWDALHNGQTPQKMPYDFMRVPAGKTLDQMRTWMFHMNVYCDAIRWEFDLLQQASEDDEVLTAFPQNPTSCNNYGGCEYADYCISWANPLRKIAQPPLGYTIDFWDPLEKEATELIDLTQGEN